MYIYFNPETQEYPRFPGDIQLIDPEWDVDKPLPEPWVQVIDVPCPVYDEKTETFAEDLPILNEDGTYTRNLFIRPLTDVEIKTLKLIEIRQKVAMNMRITKEEADLLVE